MRIHERVNIMCNKDNGRDTGNCVAEILSVINVLQQNASPENSLDSCDRPALGGGPNCLVCNTRPVMVYTCCGNGTPWSMPVCKDETSVCDDDLLQNGVCSEVFRVEKVDGNCATFRVLARTNNDDDCNKLPFVATNSFFTMDLSCACAIRCLSDTYVDCI